jgi:phasin family protein
MLFTTPSPQLLELQRSSLESLADYGGALLEAGERLTELQLALGRAVLRDSADLAQAAARSQSARQLLSRFQATAQPAAERLLAYARDAYGVSSRFSAAASQISDAWIANANRRFCETFDAVVANAPAGSESAVAWIKSAVSTANGTFDAIKNASRQVAGVTESQLDALAALADEAVKPRMRRVA